jgi:acetyltransferase-like isoleucine patch superfamily enzyme
LFRHELRVVTDDETTVGTKGGDDTSVGESPDRDTTETAPGGEHSRSDGAVADRAANPGTRKERISVHPRTGQHNSLHRWYRIRNPLRVAFNYLVILVCRISPSLRLKRWLLRRIGVTIGANVAWGLESTPDIFWPDLITVEDDALIGYDATILCHEFLVDEYRTGAVHVGEEAMIGAGAILLPGVQIGAGAQVAANSLVTEDVPPNVTVAGVPARPVTETDGETTQTRNDRNERGSQR